MRGAILGVVASAMLIGPTLAQGLGPQNEAPAQPTERVPEGAIKPMRTIVLPMPPTAPATRPLPPGEKTGAAQSFGTMAPMGTLISH